MSIAKCKMRLNRKCTHLWRTVCLSSQQRDSRISSRSHQCLRACSPLKETPTVFPTTLMALQTPPKTTPVTLEVNGKSSNNNSRKRMTTSTITTTSLLPSCHLTLARSAHPSRKTIALISPRSKIRLNQLRLTWNNTATASIRTVIKLESTCSVPMDRIRKRI